MSVTERLMRQGAWSVELSSETPEDVLDAVGFFDSIVVTNQHLLLTEGWTDAAILAAATYSGMIRVVPRGDKRVVKGIGNLGWLGDEKGKGQILTRANGIGFTPGTKTHVGWWTDLLGTIDSIASPLTAGTLSAITAPTNGGELLDAFYHVTRRDVADTVAVYYRGEYKPNHDFTVDAGQASDLFVTTPTAIIVREASGDDPTLRSVKIRKAAVVKDVVDYVTDVTAIGKGVTGTDTITSPYKDPQDAVVKRFVQVNVDTASLAFADEYATVTLAASDQVAETVTISTNDYDSEGVFKVGDTIYIYDPDSGLVDASVQKQFRGQMVFPTTIRLVGVTWPVTRGMGVYVRTGAGVYTDLTPYVVFEDTAVKLEIGALPRPRFVLGGGQAMAPVTAGGSTPAAVTHNHSEYEPVWRTWSPSYTNLTIGNGTVVSRFAQDDKTITAHFTFTLGSTSAVGTAPRVSLPVTAASGYTVIRNSPGLAYFRDDGTADFSGITRIRTTTTAEPMALDASGTHLAIAGLTATVPFTWATSDILHFTITHEAV